MKWKVYIELEGALADFRKAACEIEGESSTAHEINPDDHPLVARAMQTSEFWENMNQTAGLSRILENLRDNPKVYSVVVTGFVGEFVDKKLYDAVSRAKVVWVRENVQSILGSKLNSTMIGKSYTDIREWVLSDLELEPAGVKGLLVSESMYRNNTAKEIGLNEEFINTFGELSCQLISV